MLTTTVHNYSVPFAGDAVKALDVARTTLLSLGFEIQVDTSGELVAEGPGMHSNQQPPLLGATSVHLRLSPSEIAAEAVLGGAATMKRFIVLFPPGLVVSLLLFNNIFVASVSLIHILWVLPWFAIAPLFGRAMERSTIRAVERLVRGMAQAGRV